MTKVYAIFPFGDDGKYAGVYIGRADHLRNRITTHLCAKEEGDTQVELHRLMRRNGFDLRVLETMSSCGEDRWREYMWIKAFKEHSPLRMFNICTDYYASKTSGVSTSAWLRRKCGQEPKTHWTATISLQGRT